MTEGPKLEQNKETEKLEVVKRFVEQKQEKALEKCLEKLIKKSERIGAGDNAEVLGIKDKHFGDVCMKKMHKNPKILCNDVEAEYTFQQEVGDMGIRVPKLIAYVKNSLTGDTFILMERIVNPSLRDIIESGVPIPEAYDHDKFWAKVDSYLNTMHEGHIHHRDLHKGNIMIDKDGGPVFIDFGTASRAWGSDDNPYKDTTNVFNKLTGRYDVQKGFFQEDKGKVKWTKDEIAKLLHN